MSPDGMGLDWMGLDGISPDRSISRSPSGDKNVVCHLNAKMADLLQ